MLTHSEIQYQCVMQMRHFGLGCSVADSLLVESIVGLFCVYKMVLHTVCNFYCTQETSEPAEIRVYMVQCWGEAEEVVVM